MTDVDSPRPDQRRSLLLFVLGLILMLISASPLAAMCFIVLAARHWLADERPKAWGVVGLSAAVAAISMGSLFDGVFYGATSALGCLIGAMCQRNWSYGRRLTTLVGSACSGIALTLLFTWNMYRHSVTVFMNARVAELEAQANVNQLWLDVFRWYDLNFEYIGIGSIFGSVLLMSAYLLCVIDRENIRKIGPPRRRTTGFQRMGLPDWLVWVAIVVALLWFVDHRWPNDALRVITWNAAVALTLIYWLNGLSILLYAFATMKATALVTLLVFSGMFLFGLMHLLSLVGLFDTWCDFRIRIRRLALLRRVGLRSDDNDYE